MPKETQKAKMDAPAFKFFIGLVAGLTAMVLPRLIAALASSTEGSSVRYFSLDFAFLALAFGVIVGLVIMIFEWKIPSRPRDTFMTALGIPALLSGTLNAYNASGVARDAENLSNALLESSGVSIIRGGGTAPGEKRSENNEGWFPPGLGVARAYAQEGPHVAVRIAFNPGIQVQEPFYYVVLARADSLPKAREEGERLRLRVPNTEIIETRQGYFVVQAGGPKPRSRALLEAIRLRKELGLSPLLLEVTNGGS
ncbi:MAG: hypothetical protein AABY65_05880 [Nitrospirota bacterium]